MVWQNTCHAVREFFVACQKSFSLNHHRRMICGMKDSAQINVPNMWLIFNSKKKNICGCFCNGNVTVTPLLSISQHSLKLSCRRCEMDDLSLHISESSL